VSVGDDTAAGKVTVGFILLWPSVKDFSGLTTYELQDKQWETSIPPTGVYGARGMTSFTTATAHSSKASAPIINTN